MPKSDKQMFSQVTQDIAVIKTEIVNMSKDFSDFKTDTKKFCNEMTVKVDTNENELIATKTKVGNLAIFQSIFSVIIGAIATYLGIDRR